MLTNHIMAVTVDYRSKKAGDIQSVFSKYGCLIKVRLGLHEAGDVCSENGLIILQLTGEKTEILSFKNELSAIEGIKVNIMEI
jgi:hypothetical protein